MRGLVVAALLLACTGSNPPVPDGGFKCTGVAYDPCNDEHNCQSAQCDPFADKSIQVCTTACSASMPCPNDSTGAAGTCTAAGVCEPAKANACTPQ